MKVAYVDDEGGVRSRRGVEGVRKTREINQEYRLTLYYIIVQLPHSFCSENDHFPCS